MVRKFMVVLALGTLVSATAACNTVKGLGQDIQSVGQAGDDVM